MENTALKNRTLTTGVVSLIAMLVFVGAIMYMAQRNNGQVGLPPIMDKGQVPTEEEQVQGTLGLRLKGSEQVVSRGSTITVFIYGDSQGDQITAYDAVLHFDPAQLEFTQVKSLVEGIDIYETVEENEEGMNELIVTGVQSLDQQDAFVLTNTALAEVTFTVVQAGEIGVNLSYEGDSTLDSNLMNTRTQDILNNVVSLTLTAR